MRRDALLLSIRPRYVDKILDGTKRVELRKTRPRIQSGDLVLIYATSPISALVGAFRASSVQVHSTEQLWAQVRQSAGITREEFETYYNGFQIGVGIFFDDVMPLECPVGLDHVRDVWPGFHPPQGYLYVKAQLLDAVVPSRIELQEKT